MATNHPKHVSAHPPSHIPNTQPTVEEYVNKGDVLNEAISHPDKYSERFVATNVVKPLLSVLAYMHANNIIHRWVQCKIDTATNRQLGSTHA